MQRTAYINKDSKVVYIAAFAEDKIQADGKGKLRFGGSTYDTQTGSWAHVHGSGEEVFEVDGSGLSVGDTYMADKPQDVQQKYAETKALIAQKEEELAKVRQAILTAQADEEPEDMMSPLREKRDALKAELEQLKSEGAELEQSK